MRGTTDYMYAGVDAGAALSELDGFARAHGLSEAADPVTGERYRTDGLFGKSLSHEFRPDGGLVVRAFMGRPSDPRPVAGNPSAIGEATRGDYAKELERLDARLRSCCRPASAAAPRADGFRGTAWPAGTAPMPWAAASPPRDAWGQVPADPRRQAMPAWGNPEPPYGQPQRPGPFPPQATGVPWTPVPPPDAPGPVVVGAPAGPGPKAPSTTVPADLDRYAASALVAGIAALALDAAGIGSLAAITAIVGFLLAATGRRSARKVLAVSAIAVLSAAMAWAVALFILMGGIEVRF